MGQLNARCLWIAPEQSCNMAYPLHQFRPQGLTDSLYHLHSGIAILGINLDFNEFVMVEGEIDFIQHRLGQATAAYDNHRFFGVSKALEMAFLNSVQHVGLRLAYV